MMNLIEAFKNEARFTKKSLGQHFLTNRHILKEIAEAAGVAEGENIIEIGPGCGVLTQLFVHSGAQVAAVEIDSSLSEFLKRHFFYYKNLTIINKDALQVDFNDLFPGKEAVLAGNLPYNASVKILEKAAARRNVKSMVFMFQKEVADRIAAGPGSKTYSSLSVFTAYLFNVSKIRDIGGGNFWPNADVISTVLKFTPKKEKPLGPEDEKNFFALLRRSFTQKRKTLRNNLKNIKNIDDILSRAGLTEKSRAEELSLEDFLRLYGVVYDR